eukprot:177425-Pleurochrysis_carterae.AAC.2
MVAHLRVLTAVLNAVGAGVRVGGGVITSAFARRVHVVTTAMRMSRVVGLLCRHRQERRALLAPWRWREALRTWRERMRWRERLRGRKRLRWRERLGLGLLFKRIGFARESRIWDEVVRDEGRHRRRWPEPTSCSHVRHLLRGGVGPSVGFDLLCEALLQRERLRGVQQEGLDELDGAVATAGQVRLQPQQPVKQRRHRRRLAPEEAQRVLHNRHTQRLDAVVRSGAERRALKSRAQQRLHLRQTLEQHVHRRRTPVGSARVTAHMRRAVPCTQQPHVLRACEHILSGRLACCALRTYKLELTCCIGKGTGETGQCNALQHEKRLRGYIRRLCRVSPARKETTRELKRDSSGFCTGCRGQDAIYVPLVWPLPISSCCSGNHAVQLIPSCCLHKPCHGINGCRGWREEG